MLQPLSQLITCAHGATAIINPVPKPNPKNTFLKIALVAVIFLSLTISSKADSCGEDLDCIEKQKASVTKDLASVQNDLKSVSERIKKYGSQLTVTQAEINQLNADIKKIEDQLTEIGKKLDDRKAKLTDKINLRNYLVRNYLKRTQLNAVELFFAESINNLGLSGFEFSYLSQGLNKAASDETIKLIQGLNADIHGFEKDKAEAESIQKSLVAEQNKLLAMKADLDAKAAKAKKEEADLNKKEASLSQRLADLNAKQQEILRQKSGDENGSVGDYTPPTVSTPNPPDSLGRPAFAAFSYGAYTHYNGMSQYGAQARAKDGQDYKKILKFYYPNLKLEEDYDEPDKIRVKGSGAACNGSNKNYDETIDFSTYMKRIYEMPASWQKEALKAQAVAARTYAIRVSKSKGYIEPNQSNQVYKNCDNASGWVNAVKDTENTVLLSNDNLALTEYSSTTGGYINNVGWDAPDGINGWKDGNAYEKGSPWFYKAWYTKSYNSNDNCGRPHPWLSEKEMADILNAWVVWRKGSGEDKSHITPVTTSCWGGDPYSLDEMADKADKYDEKRYSSVSSIKADINSGGYTSQVKIETNKGTVTIPGAEFKTVYNLRAPGYVSIKSRLFDLEKRN